MIKNVKNDLLIFKCVCCKTSMKAKRFADIYKFFIIDISKFIQMLGKGVYPYEYIVNTSLPEKKSLTEALTQKILLMQITGIWKEFWKTLK